jgi:hypothetical protein
VSDLSASTAFLGFPVVPALRCSVSHVKLIMMPGSPPQVEDLAVNAQPAFGSQLHLGDGRIRQIDFMGGGYRVTIEGWGGDAKYTGCDPKERCPTIEPASFCEQGSYTWESNGYTYSMSPTKRSDGSYALKIFDPSGKVILKQPMTPVSGASRQGD